MKSIEQSEWNIHKYANIHTLPTIYVLKAIFLHGNVVLYPKK